MIFGAVVLAFLLLGLSLIITWSILPTNFVMVMTITTTTTTTTTTSIIIVNVVVIVTIVF